MTPYTQTHTLSASHKASPKLNRNRIQCVRVRVRRLKWKGDRDIESFRAWNIDTPNEHTTFNVIFFMHLLCWMACDCVLYIRERERERERQSEPNAHTTPFYSYTWPIFISTKMTTNRRDDDKIILSSLSVFERNDKRKKQNHPKNDSDSRQELWCKRQLFIATIFFWCKRPKWFNCIRMEVQFIANAFGALRAQSTKAQLNWTELNWNEFNWIELNCTALWHSVIFTKFQLVRNIVSLVWRQ